MGVKHIVLGLSALAGIGYLVKSKVTDWRKIMEQLRAFPTEFNSLNINWQKVSFVIDVTIFNTSNSSFNPDGIIAQLDRIEVDVKGQNIATISVKQHNIKIPANGKYVLKNLKVEVPVQNIFLAKNIRSYNDINTVAVINVLGQEFKI